LPEPHKDSHPHDDPIFNETYPDILVEAAAGIEAFDTIIVDEGQDFLDTWWNSLLLLLRNEDSSFHIYFDDNQQLWRKTLKLPKEIVNGAMALDLTENVRNTKSIHNLAMRFHPSLGIGYKALSELNIEPEFIPFSSDEREDKVVQKLIENLINNEGILPNSIAILTPLSILEGRSIWRPGNRLGRYLLVHHIQPKPDEIFCSSIRSAKGLEFSVVIMTELSSSKIEEDIIKGDIKNYAPHLYVGLSRARSNLIIMSSREDFERLFTMQ
jgi:superfamily I DNA/RNA helicase